jgi:Ca-activated chloride channel family protein
MLTQDAPGKSCDLRYLLTAYLFDNISEAGRREVEAELATNPACRAELEELRRTLAIVEDALRGDGSAADASAASPYRFDERRMKRVIDAAGKRPARRRWWLAGLTPVAAAALIVPAAFVALLVALSQRSNTVVEDNLYSVVIPESARFDIDGRGGRERPEHWNSLAEEVSESSPAAEADRQTGLLAGGKVSESRSEELSYRRTGGGTAGSASSQSGGAVPVSRKAPAAAGKAKPQGPLPPARDGEVSAAPAATASPANEPPRPPDAPPAAEARDAKADPARAVEGLVAGFEWESNERTSELQALSERRAPSQERLRVLSARAGEQAAGKKVDADRFAKESVTESPPMEGPMVAVESRFLDTQDDFREEIQKEFDAGAGTIGRLIPDANAPGKDGGRQQSVELRRLREETVRVDGKANAWDRMNERDKKDGLNVGGIVAEDREKRRSEQSTDSWSYRLRTSKSDEKRTVDELQDAYSRWYFPAPETGLQARGEQSADDARRAADFPPDRVARIEKQLLGYRYYRGLDPDLPIDGYWTRPVPVPPPAVGDEGLGEEGFRRKYGVHPFVDTRRDALSTFGMDVGTASFHRSRAVLEAGRLPPPQTVRVEEFVNSFPEAAPADPASVFSVFSEGGPSPFGGGGLELLKVTLKSRELRAEERRSVVLTFAIDASGSMALGGHLATVRQALRSLVESSTLGPADRLAIVAFSSQAYVLLPQTSLAEKERILAALDGLEPRGGTNVEAGLDLAYRLADEGLQPRALNRIVLCSDGLANLGARSPDEVLQKVKGYKERGIYLSVFGLGGAGDKEGEGDRMLLRLANEGNGVYAYLDSPDDASRAFSEDLRARLHVLAQDAKVQVHFNPDVVTHYRLLGYEQREIADADFRNDKRDAGEVGPGATVTVLYEIQRRPATPGSLGRIHLRYRDTWRGRVEEVDWDLPPGVLATRLDATSDRFRFIAAVAELAELLRGSHFARDGSYSTVLDLLGTLGEESRQGPEFATVENMVRLAQKSSLRQILGESLDPQGEQDETTHK